MDSGGWSAQIRRVPMNIHHLELFYYVARHGGIMPAVRNMPYGIQQPAVSGQIIQLEGDLGLKLFHRRPFELTDAGRELFEFIQPFFASVDEMSERLRGGVAQRIRLAAPDMALRDHLPEVLKFVRGRFPKLTLTLRAAHQPQVEDWLVRHEIDFAVSLIEGRPAPGVNSEVLLELPVALVVPPDYPGRTADQILDALAAGKGPAGRSAAAAPVPPLVALPQNETATRRFREFLHKRGFEWPTSIEVTALELIGTYVAAGLGVGVSLAVPGAVMPEGVRVLPIAGIPPVKLGALWRGKPTPVMDLLLQGLRARAAAAGRRAR